MSELRLGNLQLRIMQVLWTRGPATVLDVHDALKRSGLAYTTIATMLRKMEDRGLVSHRASGRKFIYEAAVSAQDVTRSMAGDLLDRLFEGSLADMVHHLLTERDVSPEELQRLEALIAQRRKQTSRGAHAR
jgi:predicted transcriptional regulator